METKLTHPFLFLCTNRQELLDDCHLLNTFLSRLEKQAKAAIDKEKYKGDGFELFCEALIRLSPVDKRIAIRDYKIITNGDTGVDGHGIGINNRPATVQCKFRQANWILTANNDHLSNFVMSSNNKFGVQTTDKDNMLIITSGKALHHHTNIEMFDEKVRCLNRDNLRQLVDENMLFWEMFRNLWEEALRS